ncbi:MAG TPA: hypothetical protein VM715_22055, partial [Candidatus Acidoferrum sp.]|nr:hypothetical protein [Candidatus Acidoferrum sp.]
THFLKFASGYMLGRSWFDPPVDAYDGSVPMKQWFIDFFGTNEAVWRDIKLAYRQGGMKRTMPSRGFGRMLSWACRQAGAEVWVTTTRPYLRLDNIDPDTRFWLDREGVVYDGLIYDENKYTHLASLVGRERVVAVLEDLPEQFDDAKRLFGASVPILYRDHHNRCAWPSIPPSQIAHSGEVARQLIVNRIKDWKGLANAEGVEVEATAQVPE